jgi:hypothetical protein
VAAEEIPQEAASDVFAGAAIAEAGITRGTTTVSDLHQWHLPQITSIMSEVFRYVHPE